MPEQTEHPKAEREAEKAADYTDQLNLQHVTTTRRIAAEAFAAAVGRFVTAAERDEVGIDGVPCSDSKEN